MIYAYEEKNPRFAGCLKVGYASAGSNYSTAEGGEPDEGYEEEDVYDETLPPERRYGTVVQLKSGYGFITPEKGDHDFFFLWEDLENCEFDELSIGEKVEFEVGTNDRGECARKVLWLDSNGVPYSAPPPRENEEKQDEGGTNQSF